MRAGCNGVRLWGVAGEGTLIQTTRTRFKTWPAHLFVSRWRATRCYAASTRRLHCRPPTRAEFVEVIGETLPVNEVSLFLKDGSKVGGNLEIIFLVESRVNFGRWNIFEISLRMDASVEILLYFLLSLFSVPLIIHRAIEIEAAWQVLKQLDTLRKFLVEQSSFRPSASPRWISIEDPLESSLDNNIPSYLNLERDESDNRFFHFVKRYAEKSF